MQTSPISPTLQRSDVSARRGFERAVLTGVLNAVSAVNRQFLEALTECARSESAEFPLDASLRARMAGLTPDEGQKAARCGVFLADANFLDFACWREVALEGESTRSTELLRAWLSIEESRSLAHSVLLVAWHLIHANPAVARVLLGMSASGVGAFRELSLADLAHIARRHPGCVRPRWAHRLEVWTDVLGGTPGGGTPDSRSLTLRCLKASARDLKWLSAYVELSP